MNGKAERANRTLVEHANALLLTSGLPLRLWAKAITHVAYLRNQVNSRSIEQGQTPYELATDIKPDLAQLAVFGCMVYVHNQHPKKLGSKSSKGHFVSVNAQTKGVRVYWKA